jgi:hypothetical protein
MIYLLFGSAMLKFLTLHESLYWGELSRLLGSPNRIPLKIHPSISQGRFFSQHNNGVALILF